MRAPRTGSEGMQEYLCDALGLILLHESEELTSIEFVSVFRKDEYEHRVEMDRRYRERKETGL
ncbi:MAG: hypothetical protein WD080_02580 [Egibacteraceae bacterium]